MNNILHHKVLTLNSLWQPVNFTTVKSALEDMNSSRTPKKALKIEYAKDNSGNYNFNEITEMLPLSWDEWVTILPREYDEDVIHTVSLNIRVPTVIIAGKYNKMPIKTFKPTKRNIYNRYGGKCIWTGQVIPYNAATLEHMTPKSRNGDNSWKNLAIADPAFNRLKDNLNTEEFEKKYGIRPKYKLSEPAPIPANLLIKEITNPDWQPFLLK